MLGHLAGRRRGRFRFSAAMEVENRAPSFHLPARGFVSAGHALQIHPILLEVEILFVPANRANESFERSHI